MISKVIYLDNNASTKTDPKVVEAMHPYWSELYGNPSSNSHILSWKSEEAVDISRQQVANLIGAEKQEIFFTSGATEGNNMVIKCCGLKSQNHLITSSIEHKCVLEAAYWLKVKEKVKVDFLEVNNEGQTTIENLISKINPKTRLISLMWVNNEIHTINNIKAIGSLCKQRNILFHVDAAQAVGKMKINVSHFNIDFLTLSGHKFYAPNGIGALYIKGGIQNSILTPLIHGGGQEKGIRSGTIPVPLIVGLGEASRLSSKNIQNQTEFNKITLLTRYLYDFIRDEICETKLNGPMLENRQIGGLNLSFPGIDAGELQFYIPEVCFSRGSACSSGSLDYSYVLKEIGLSSEEAIGTLRISVGRFNTEEEIHLAAESISSGIKKLYEKKAHNIPIFKNQHHETF